MQGEKTPTPVGFPLPARLLGIPGVQPLELEIVEAGDLGTRMRRLNLAGANLADWDYRPGQDVMLVLGGTPDRPLSRRYSVRSLDRSSGVLELNIVSHGVHGPGAQWATSARPGDRVDGVGPRGKVFVDPDADWHLFLGDESAAPATLNMLEALAAASAGVAYLEVSSELDEAADKVRVGGHEVKWLRRGETAATSERSAVRGHDRGNPAAWPGPCVHRRRGSGGRRDPTGGEQRADWPRSDLPPSRTGAGQSQRRPRREPE